MSTQPISNPSLKPHAKPFILPKVQWIGRQILALGKTVYSQLAKITNLFYQTIKTYPKTTLVLLTGTIILLIYSKRKSLLPFLQLGSQEKILEQKINDLSEQLSKDLEAQQKQFAILDGNITAISKMQKTIQDKHFQITDKQGQLKKDFDALIEPMPKSASSKEKIASLETQIKNLQDFEPRIQEFIEETAIYKNNLSDSQNPF